MTWRQVTLLASAVVVSTAAAGYAHPVPRSTARELVRIQGYRSTAPREGVKHQLVVSALGVEHVFAATDFQTFGFSESAPDAAPTPAEARQRFALQGTREDLARFAAARPEQRVTLLAEHRKGSADLFVLALDLCPPQ